MSNRPPSSSGARPMTGARGQLGTSAGRPAGTATRLTTAMNPGTARPGTRGGAVAGGVALNSQVNVVDRPTTQQGLGGMKTAARGRRQVMDKTYFLGLLRSKLNDLNGEINNLNKDIENTNDENSSFLTYDKRAEVLAGEIRDLQAELGDYNILVDKLTIDEDIQDVEFDCNNLKAQNDRDSKKIEEMFEVKKQKEEYIAQLEMEIDQEKRMADNLVNDMDPKLRQKYQKLKTLNDHLLKQTEIGQQELDQLNSKIETLQEDLSMSQVKQEAVRLYEQIHELTSKRDSLIEESKQRGSPAEEREKLLKQVKEDNQEIASMERQIKEINEKIESLQDDINQYDMDIEENQGEKNQKYKELRKREETMDEFLDTFEDTKAQELKRMTELQGAIVNSLEHVSRNMGRFGSLPTPGELATMKDDLAFKEDEMKKSETTTIGLASERDKLEQDLKKLDVMEEKLHAELSVLKEKSVTMQRDIVIYSDLDKLKEQAEEKKQKLQDDRVILQKRREAFKKHIQQMTAKYEGLKSQLNDNETYTQLANLERKWQHHEQNNFSMKEFIATRTMECDYRPLSKQFYSMMDEYNQILQDKLAGKKGM
ncbi:intraflagellar transport protein 74 homolog [Patella vulgata]|uniref:intraflagellar transport protein 74 homolog n=1 Tax=Patella vulgata TaxID=6465 RepID=UPI0021806908|nr:intraflagellar transport protein 74 homolog [Patella vulgata]